MRQLAGGDLHAQHSIRKSQFAFKGSNGKLWLRAGHAKLVFPIHNMTIYVCVNIPHPGEEAKSN